MGDQVHNWFGASAAFIATLVLVAPVLFVLASNKWTRSKARLASDEQDVKETTGPALMPPKEEPDEAKTQDSAIAQRSSQSTSKPSESLNLNEVLVRQLLADPEFQMNTETEDPNAARVKKMMEKALWDMIQADAEENTFTRLLSLIEEVKLRLQGVTPHRKDLQAEIEGAMDLVLLEQIFETHPVGTWDLKPLCTFVIGRIRNLEAPVRNAETDAWLKTFLVQIQDSENPFVSEQIAYLHKFFTFVHRKLDLISIDTQNAYLRQIQPVVAQHGFDLLRKKFEEKLERGDINREKVESFLSSLGDFQTSGKALPEVIREEAMEFVLPGGKFQLELADPATVFLQHPELPPQWNEERFNLARLVHNAQVIWRTAAAILRVRQIFPEADDELLQQVCEIVSVRVGDQVQVSGNEKETVIASMSRGSLAKLASSLVIAAVRKRRELTETDRKALQDLLHKSFHPDASDEDRVQNLLNNRLRSLFACLVLPSTPPDSAAQLLKPLQLHYIEAQVLKLAHDIRKFVDRDLAVHGNYYTSSAFTNSIK